MEVMIMYKKRPMGQEVSEQTGGAVLEGKLQWGLVQLVSGRFPILRSISVARRWSGW